MPDRELRRSKLENARGRLELERVERLSPEERARVREEWWRERRYHVVTPGSELIEAALPPPLARYLAPLLVTAGGPPELPSGRGEEDGLAAFHELIAPGISSRTS